MKNCHGTVGVALGGGGVRGLAHVPALATIEACGIRPAVLAGTSMGAIIGALYASGKSAKDLCGIVEHHIIGRDDRIKDIYAKKDSLLKWLTSVRLAWKGSGLLEADGFLRHLLDQMNASRFEDLKIPLHVVATDFYSGESVVFNRGPLLPALKASMSIPGIFVPVEHEGRILVDGGVSNNLPFDLLAPRCDVTIAIDVAPTREINDAEPPNMLDATLGMFDMLVERITTSMVLAQPPHVYFHPRLVGIRVLDFDKAEDVLEQTEQAIGEFKKMLAKQLH
jgi:NTE family protein